MPHVDGKADRLGDCAAQLALPGYEQVAHGAGAIVIFGGSGEHETAAGEILVAFEPGEPVREQGSETRQALVLLHGGGNHLLEEKLLRPPERPDLQVRTLRRAQELFLEQVVSPAVKQDQGLPRLRALFSNWLAWLESNEDLPGGCLMLAASAEYDDRPGPVRDLLVAGQRELRGAIAKAIRLAIDEGHLKPQTDPWQLTFELFGIVLAAQHDLRLLGDARVPERARSALERLIEAHRALY